MAPDPDKVRKVYQSTRENFIKKSQAILAIERRYHMRSLKMCYDLIDTIEEGFNGATNLRLFWENYPPAQRGRKPKGESFPWAEVGEKCIGQILACNLDEYFNEIRFVSLPYGGDLRFATPDAFVHFDIKCTGPNDNPNEIVASPNQLSGDGSSWNSLGFLNTPLKVQGLRRPMIFQPELPPLYVSNYKPKLCISQFLKVVYEVESMGVQPLSYVELVTAPNGLLIFEGPTYKDISGLFTPGKDEKEFKHKRVRLKLYPLALKDHWRCTKIVKEKGKWVKKSRQSGIQKTLQT